tara:strand:+ start:260 stop:505 length:246 start_codon:yes stop_codon:yes gene_type:complete
MDVKVKQIKKSAKKDIVGQKIKNIFLEIPDSDWIDVPVVIIELENGVNIYAQSDDEFNNSGIMVSINKKDEVTHLNYEGLK